MSNNLPHQLQQQQPTIITNNGIDDSNMNNSQNESMKQLPNMTGPGNRPPRNNYYQQQNNGNYNSRPRQNRNGMPRQGGNNRNN